MNKTTKSELLKRLVYEMDQRKEDDMMLAGCLMVMRSLKKQINIAVLNRDAKMAICLTNEYIKEEECYNKIAERLNRRVDIIEKIEIELRELEIRK